MPIALPVVDEKCSHSCGGVCCQDFAMSAPPERLGFLYEWAVAHIWAGEASSADWDMVRMCEMLIRIDEPDEASPRYTCQHFDTNTGLCGAYDLRPLVCSRYSYGRACFHCGYQNYIISNETLKP